ncbi:VWA domain-containing protein [Terriglobus sp.]|uniref:VWA domain-containing protein n=1 Tax=Terriglobus sp. TaxID=1889013 RepID=UPI003B004CAE
MRALLCAALFAGLSILPVLPVAHAQEAPSPGGPPPASAAPPPADDDLPQGGTLKVRVNLVNTYFSARDKGGYLTGLHKDDCQVFENKEPQTIKNFTQEKNLPLTIGILLDTSGSMQNVLPLEKDAAADFLRDVIKPKDEAFLINFDINVDLLADYTNSTRELRRGLDKAEINTGAGTGSVTGNSTPRGTLLYDAVYLATHDKLRQEAGRKVVVILSDGDDQGSQVKLKEAVEAAQKANTIVYVILIRDSGFSFGGGYSMSFGGGAMDQLTRETGGRVINGGNGKHLDEAFQQISDELRTQYLLSYTPKNPNIDGTFRAINITCGNGVKIQSRKGYYAVADSTTE